jgi:hypothetical protein
LDKEESQVRGRWILGLSLLVASSFSSARADSAAYQKAILADKDLIGFWAFENNLADQTSNKNDAKPGGKNPAAVTFVDGVNGGRAVHIDNPDGNGADTGTFVEVNTPAGSIFDQAKFTILYWARNDSPAEATSDDQWNSLVDRNSLWYTELWSGDEGNTLGQNLVVRIYDPTNPTGGGTGQIGRYDVSIDDRTPYWAKKGEWHQYAMTYDGAKVMSYTDGKKMLEVDYDGGVGPTADTPKDPPHNNYNLTWGAWQQRGDWYTGGFDDTAYFKRVLSKDEITAFHDAMVAKP